MRLKVYANIRLSDFLCVLAVSCVICWPSHLFSASCVFQSYQKSFRNSV